MVHLRTPAADRVLDLEDEETDAVLAALSPESARRVLAALDAGAATVPELADRTDLTAQNVSYHVEKLVDADLVRAAGTRGTGATAATVYEPAESVLLSTEPAVERRVPRVGVAGLAVGALLAVTCLHSVGDPSMALAAVVEHGLGDLAALFRAW